MNRFLATKLSVSAVMGLALFLGPSERSAASIGLCPTPTGPIGIIPCDNNCGGRAMSDWGDGLERGFGDVENASESLTSEYEEADELWQQMEEDLVEQINEEFDDRIERANNNWSEIKELIEGTMASIETEVAKNSYRMEGMADHRAQEFTRYFQSFLGALRADAIDRESHTGTGIPPDLDFFQFAYGDHQAILTTKTSQTKDFGNKIFNTLAGTGNEFDQWDTPPETTDVRALQQEFVVALDEADIEHFVSYLFPTIDPAHAVEFSDVIIALALNVYGEQLIDLDLDTPSQQRAEQLLNASSRTIRLAPLFHMHAQRSTLVDVREKFGNVLDEEAYSWILSPEDDEFVMLSKYDRAIASYVALRPDLTLEANTTDARAAIGNQVVYDAFQMHLLDQLRQEKSIARRSMALNVLSSLHDSQSDMRQTP